MAAHCREQALAGDGVCKTGNAASSCKLRAFRACETEESKTLNPEERHGGSFPNEAQSNDFMAVTCSILPLLLLLLLLLPLLLLLLLCLELLLLRLVDALLLRPSLPLRLRWRL